MTDRFLICLDPESFQFYSIGISSKILILELDVPTRMREKALNTIKDIKKLQETGGTNWWINSNQAWTFRKRHLPKYLINKNTSLFPRYLQLGELSSAFADSASIEINLDLTKYGALKSEGTIKVNLPAQYPLIFPLATGADEVIKKCIRNIYRDYRIRLVPTKSENRFAMKSQGYHEFFYGDIPLLNYDRVRASLRSTKSLNVMLIEIPYKEQNSQFPPIVERTIKDVLNQRISPIPWKDFEKEPIVVWYPPIPLPDFNPEEFSELTVGKYIYYNREEIEVAEIPRAYIHYSMDHFHNSRHEALKNNYAMFKRNTVYSGEIEFPFRIKVLGLENIRNLISQTENGITGNGVVVPRYITKDDTMETPSHKLKREDIEKLPPRLAKSKNSIQATSVPNHSDQGANCSTFTHLTKDYEFFPFLPYVLMIEAKIYHGNKLLSETAISYTNAAQFCNYPRWSEWLTFGKLKINEIPLESKIGFNIIMYSQNGESKIIGSAYLHLFDLMGKMKTGLQEINVWPFYKVEPQAVAAEGFWGLPSDVPLPGSSYQEQREFICKNWCRIVLQLDDYACPVYYSLKDYDLLRMTHELPPEVELNENDVSMLASAKKKKKKDEKQAIASRHSTELLKLVPNTDELAQLYQLIQRDPLNHNFSDKEKEVLIKARHHYKTLTKGLPIFLLAIDWSDPILVKEAHRMIREWSPLEPSEAVVLLDAQFGDEAVRAYAVERVSLMSDDELSLFLVELAMALIYEPSHFSFLGEMLLERSLNNHQVIGHEFYWLLVSQLHVKVNYERYFLLLEQYLMLTGSYRADLLDQVYANESMQQIAEDITKLADKKAMKGYLKSAIDELNKESPPNFCFSLDSRMRVSGYVPEECKIMDSKKLPLWIAGKNSQPKGDKILIIFKVGDDLRQDLLTLQLIRIMDKLWLDNGLDLRMKPYRVICTADQVGIIEVVLNSNTFSGIQKEYGGTFGALKDTTLKDYIEKYNPDPTNKARAIDNFTRSCAGYCVATYILGIGDRHTGNIMLTKSGHLFHIDFGHILGNFKSKFGIKRERTPFVLTPEMACVMGGKESDEFARFTEFCVKAYNIVRKHGHMLINLFMMMISAGMPELTELTDIVYLQKQLSFELNDQEAAKKFRDEINSCLNSNTFRRIDNMFHNLKRDG